MKRSTKKLISILICLALALGLLPMAAFAAGTTKVYCQAPDGWTKCYIHYWGSGETSWPGVEMSQDDQGIWFYEVPSDVAGLIFNNGNGTQTSDLSIPTAPNVMYLFAKSEWHPYGKIKVDTAYYVAGTSSLCGVDWQPGASQNEMTEKDGVYTITYTNIAAGSHKFKVTNGTWDQSWGQDAGNADYVLTLTEETNTVTIIFDPAVPSVDVEINGSGHEPEPPVDNGIYYVAGSFNGWNAAADGYLMATAGSGVYEYIMQLDAGDYAMKVTNGTWDLSWGDSATLSGNYEFTVEHDGSTVCVTFNFETQQITVIVSKQVAGEIVIAEGTASFATSEDAWNNPDSVDFIPAVDGTVTIEITDCDPGFWVEVYGDGEWIEDYLGDGADVIEIPVQAGVTYGFDLSSAYDDPLLADKVAGSITYRISSNVPAGEPGGEEEPGDGLGSSEANPQPITASYGNYIEADQTVWFIYDNYEHMMKEGVYSQMLYISAGVSYEVTYRGANVPVDEQGFVTYEMQDVLKQGKYVFSLTNKAGSKAFFKIDIKDRPVYVVSEQILVLGDNTVEPSEEYTNTLYEFTPDETGVYTFTISNGVIGNWGTIFNPVDNTENKVNTLQWTCTDKGQSILVGVADTEQANLNIQKTGDYVADDQVDETNYQNEYGFTYQLPENPELVKIDVLDDKQDVAVLDDEGFYRYGSKYGPLMVTNLEDFPINLADAILNGQLRAYECDKDGKVTAKHNYNDAMTEYLDAGLVPVTKELAMMLQQLGDHHGWWLANGFVFEGDAPADEETAWMTACSYIKGSELTPDNNGNNQGGNNNNSNNPPKTMDISMAWAMIVMVLASSALVLLKKKETFFLN